MLSLQHDTGRWCTEYTYSAEDSMLGVRLLHNFGKLAAQPGSAEESERSATSRGGGMKMKRIDEEDAMEGGLKGRFSAGAEIYFSAKERSAGGL
jgi:mitochondrial distribution and morphology protein 10